MNGLAINTKTTEQASGTSAVSTYFIAIYPLQSGDAVLAYIDGDALDGNTVTISSGAAISGLDIYGNDTVIARHETAGPVTNSTFNTAKGSLTTDIIYSVASSNLTIDANDDFLVWTGDTYTPGGTLTTDDLTIQSSATYDAGGNNIDVSGDWTNSGTYTSGANTVDFNGLSAQTIDTGGIGTGQDFNNIEISNASSTVTLISP